MAGNQQPQANLPKQQDEEAASKTATAKRSKLPLVIFFVYFSESDEIRELNQEQLATIDDPKFVICDSKEDALKEREKLIREKAVREARVMRAKAKTERARAEFDRKHPGLARKNQQRTEAALEEAQKSVAAAKAQKERREKEGAASDLLTSAG